MDSFCGSSFWDVNTTWNTNDPDLTPCFEKTLLTWIPFGFLLLFPPFLVYIAANSKQKSIPVTFLGFLQHSVALTLAVLQVIEYCIVVWKIDDEDKIYYSADHVEVAVKFSTYALALALQIYTKRKGIRSSAVLFIFWVLTAISRGFEYDSAVRSQPGRYKYDNQKLHQILTIVTFPLVVAELFLHFFADNATKSMFSKSKKDSEKDNKFDQTHKNLCPEYSSSIPNRFTYQWMYSLLWTGYKRPLEFEDMWELGDENKALTIFEEFNDHWRPRFNEAQKWNKLNKQTTENPANKENAPLKRNRKSVPIFPSLWKAIRNVGLASAMFKLGNDFFAFASPQILNLLIAHVAAESTEERWKGYFYVGILGVVIMMQSVCEVNHSHLTMLTGMRLQSIISEAVYRKSLLLSNAARKDSTIGQIVNLMSVDAQLFKEQIFVIHFLWSGPLTFLLAIYFLWNVLGVAALTGMLILLMTTIATFFCTHKNKSLRSQQMKTKDDRMRLMNEMLTGIKILKLYAWEPAFEKKVEEIRKEEIKLLRQAAYITSVMFFINFVTPSLVALVSFTVYVFIDEKNNLNAQKIFVSLAFFNLMRRPVLAMSVAIANAIQMNVSLTRLNKFMNAEEINPDDVTHENQKDGTVVRIENGNFSWDARGGDTTLKNINLEVKQGDLVGVVGIVGSGKSSLLSAILGEMEKLSGKMNRVGSIAYVSQQAWVQNATLRDNILFGKRFDQKLYQKVIEACALEPDFKILVGGDMTEIGQNGINLSGGQKQRVALARAVYSQADVYLLDDPLSAVDAHVGQHIFNKIMGPHGLLRNKTRIVVTHGITYLPKVDKIIVLTNGKVGESGTYTELLNNKGAFADFLIEHSNPECKGSTSGGGDIQNLTSETSNEIDRAEPNRMRRPRTTSILSTTSTISLMEDAVISTTISGSEVIDDADRFKLIKEEVSEVGGIKKSVYTFVFRSTSWTLAITSISMYTITHALNLYSNLWLSKWADVPTVNGTQDEDQRNLYLGVFGGLTAGEVLTMFIANLATSLGFLKAAQVMHTGMLAKVLRSPMSFFDTTPTGRIINKFSKDLDAPDNVLPFITIAWLAAFFRTLVSLVGISINAPLFLVFLVPVGGLFFALQMFYKRTSQQLKRIESVSRSPVLSKFSETLTGITIIRAFKAQKQCSVEFERDVDRNQMVYFPFLCTQTWFVVILEMFGNLVVLFTSIFVLATDTGEGSVGMSITYALTITTNLSTVVRQFVNVQNCFVSVERIKEYFDIEQEASWEDTAKKPLPAWPEQGSIVFKNFQIRYREGLDLVLKNVDCRVNPAEKVAVVGRTGAGKSSLTLGLFRIMEAAGGSIEIDGINIADLGLHDVRGRLTIIPQDPVLFVGTLRLNLDPHEKCSDVQIWKALEFAHLKDFVSMLPGSLEATVEENGNNFSVGQRQLVCLARALLRKTKILILDEATAAVDLETDDLIQKTIRSEFKDSTVLTIAHRLNTIMDYDRIMVLDSGVVEEFATPQALLQNSESIFFSMAREAKII